MAKYTVEDLEELVEKLEELTEINSVTESYLVIAEFFKLKKYIQLFGYIWKIQDIEKSMNYNLGQYRYGLYNEMRDIITRQEGKEVSEYIFSAT
jgi:hypothetical protein